MKVTPGAHEASRRCLDSVAVLQEQQTSPLCRCMLQFDLHSGYRLGLFTDSALQSSDAQGTPKAVVRASTIDNFQGEEARIVIVSLTRSNAQGQIGFLKEAQRVNVLLSRARDALILVGNPHCLLGRRGTLSETGQTLLLHGHAWSKDQVAVKEVLLEYTEDSGNDKHHRPGKGTWETVLQAIPMLPGFPARCEQHSTDHLLTSPEEFDQHVPDGGCTVPCDADLSCGHKCASRCHSKRQHHAPCMVIVDCKCAAKILYLSVRQNMCRHPLPVPVPLIVHVAFEHLQCVAVCNAIQGAVSRPDATLPIAVAIAVRFRFR